MNLWQAHRQGSECYVFSKQVKTKCTFSPSADCQCLIIIPQSDDRLRSYQAVIQFLNGISVVG